jgi:hypothetical protein
LIVVEQSDPVAAEDVHAVPDTQAGRRESVEQKVRSIEAAAIAGVGFAILSVVALQLLESFPELTLTDAELQEWFDDSGNRTGLIIGCNLMALSAIMFLWFTAVIRRRLGDLEDRFFGTVFSGSAAAFVAIWLAHGAAVAAPAVAVSHLDGATVDNASLSDAAGLGAALLLVIGPRIQAVFVLVTSTLFVRSKVLPTWLGILGYLVALGMLVFPLILDPLGLGFPLWVFVVSVTILAVRPRAREIEAAVEG